MQDKTKSNASYVKCLFLSVCGFVCLNLFFNFCSVLSKRSNFTTFDLNAADELVQKVDNAIHRINHYRLDSAIAYPKES